MSDEVINKAKPHTIKKFELIERYVETWAQKLLQNQNCDRLVFIDCMSNSGEYDDNGKRVYGTPVRVANCLHEVAGQYFYKQIDLYFNDLSKARTEHLKGLLPKERKNFHCHVSTEDGNVLIKRLGVEMAGWRNTHCLLVYDPYDAAIDWEAIFPFVNSWSEVILNHMVSDPVRAVKTVKRASTRTKYEQTYLTEFENLMSFGSDKEAYEERLKKIIKALRQNQTRQYYVAAFPFFNGKNVMLYELLHCTSNIEGFKLYKQSAWKTFGGKSSTKNTHGSESQMALDFGDEDFSNTKKEEFCYYVKDIAEYLARKFRGEKDVPLERIWGDLDNHPIFPADGYRKEIKKELKQNYGATITRSTISFL